jgi:glycine cleavage system aminomethyltransferase T/glycine/D-amino acid oxidase-like deaminating enzyme
MSTPTLSLPSHAPVIIVGGGIVGVSIAYHLAELGMKEVLLLERDRLTSGTTWHAAGLVASAGMASETMLWIQQYSRQLYERLEAETGLSTGFRRIGHIHLATSEMRREIQRRDRNFAALRGLEKHEISPREVQELFPLVETQGVISGMYTPSDGRANPVDVTMSLAKGARQRGARIIEGVVVEDFIMAGSRVIGVRTAQGEVRAETVVLAAGMWSRQLGARIGVSVPLQAAEHYYLLTEPIAEVHPNLPVVEDPDAYAYVREENAGLLFGLFEPKGACWALDGVPQDASFLNLPADWERMTPFLEHAFKRIPVMNQVGIKSFFCGPESFTADGNFLVGESPEVDRLFLATGLNSSGILAAGGIGRIVAEMIVHGNSSQDVTALAPARSPTHESTRTFLAQRIPDTLSYLFNFAAIPNFKHTTARNVRRLALHDRYQARGAYFVPVSGWETPLWFAHGGPKPAVEHRFGRQVWFELSAREHRATRECVGLFDKSFMGKFLIQGHDAETVLNRVSANSISVPIGRNVYTQWLNDQGRIVSDLTITRLDEASFLLVTGEILQRSTLAWLRRHTHRGDHCTATDLTSAFTLLSVQGPKSRELLESICRADLSTERVPFRSSCEVELGCARIRLVRITFMGELGYELYIPTEYSHTVYDTLVKGIEDRGVEPVHCGLMALESLRLEKGYRDFGVDIDNTDTPVEAGLGFVVDMRKPDFIGREALARQMAQGPPRTRLVQFLLKDHEPLLRGQEPILCDGAYCGYIRAGAFGHTLGASVGLGSIELDEGITSEVLSNHTFEIEVDERHVGAVASLSPLYDPKSERIRA